MGSAASSSSSTQRNLWNDNNLGEMSQFYEVGEVLGRGGFATVFEAQTIRQRSNSIVPSKVAIKTILCHHSDADKTAILVENEIDIMRSLNHPHCVRFFDHFREGPASYLVMELAEGTNLLNHVVRQKSLNEQHSAIIIKQIASALGHMNDVGVVHRDIKLENILITMDHDGLPSIKVIDYGLAVFHRQGELMSEMCGTPVYASPEMLLQAYGSEIDYWALGVVLYMLLSGYPPFFENDRVIDSMFKSILNADFKFHEKKWSHISQGPKDLIKQLLSLNPNQRPDAKEIMENKWILENAGMIALKRKESRRTMPTDFTEPKFLSEKEVSRVVESWRSYYESFKSSVFSQAAKRAAIDKQGSFLAKSRDEILVM